MQCDLRSLALAVLVYAALAGLFCGFAALSTPRAFPFVLGLFLALGLELILCRSWKLWVRGPDHRSRRSLAGMGMDVESGVESDGLAARHCCGQPRRQDKCISHLARLLAPFQRPTGSPNFGIAHHSADGPVFREVRC